MEKILIDDLRNLLGRLESDETFRKLVKKWLRSEYEMSDHRLNQLFLMLEETCGNEDIKEFSLESAGSEFEEPLITLLSVYKNQCG